MSPLKRAIDLVGAGVGMLVLWPLFVLIGLLVRLSDGGPVFFRQERIGWRGHPFRIWKFRTMRPGAERQGALITARGDPRITGPGAWLRRTKLDELPQLLNVLRGEMSLVGPRPEVAKYVAQYTPDQARVLELVPGITDPASIAYRDEGAVLGVASDPDRTYVHVIMPEKIRLNLEYAARATRWSDLILVLKTLAHLAGFDGEVPVHVPGPVD